MSKIELAVTYGSAPGTVENGVTGIDMITGDNSIVSENNRISNPIKTPGSGLNYSREKYVQIHCKENPDTQLYNFRVWSQNTQPDTGITYYWRRTSGYNTPVVPVSLTGWVRQDTNYTSSGSSITVSGILTASGEYTEYLVMMYTVDPTASSGAITEIDINLLYDEQ